MSVSRVYQYLNLEILSVLGFDICSHIQFFLHTTPLVWNNIFGLKIYKRDFLYHTYLRIVSKTLFLYLLCHLIPSESLAICPSLSHLKHLLVSLSFFFDQHSFAMYPYLLQLKYFGFPSLKLSLDFPMFMDCPCSLYVVLVLVL